MGQQKGLFSELLSRRVPQILGMYVASAWLCIEIAEWMGERFPVPQGFSSHVGVFLFVLLPAVAILAWGHGKPGKDQWTKFQMAIILCNVVLAAWASLQFVRNETPEFIKSPATPDLSQKLIDQTTVVDEATGKSVTYEVAKSGQNQKISLFFFDNNSGDESLDWLTGGASWLLSKDMKRSPFISVDTPFDSENMRLGLQDKGFKKGVNEPLSLDLQIAQNRTAQWVIKGEVYKENNEVAFKASLYDVVTGALIKTVSHRHANWLTALDYISSEMTAVILEKQAGVTAIPDLSIEQHVSSDLKAIKLVIEALQAVKFENDYKRAKEALLASVALDPNIAETYVLQMHLYMNMGDYLGAGKMAKKALALDYKLYDEDVFGVKAQLYAMSGDEDKAMKVIENWAKIYPESTDALWALGQNLVIKGHRLGEAESVFKRIAELEQSGQYLTWLSKVYLLQGDYQKSEQSLNLFLKSDPEAIEALVSLGKISQTKGDFKQAAGHFEEAMLAANNAIEPAILSALNLGISQSPDEALSQLNTLFGEARNDNEKFAIFNGIEQMYLQKGQLSKALESLNDAEETSQVVQSPIAHLLTHQGKKMAYLNGLGKTEEATELLNQLEQETQAPFNKTIVFMRLSFHSLQDDGPGIAKYLEQAKSVMEEFKMSVYQQFIYNYEAVMKRSDQQYDEAQQWHFKAVAEAEQSIVALSSQELIGTFKYEQARTYLMSKQYDSAIKVVDELLVNKPRSAEFMFLKARILYTKGDVGGTKVVIEKIRALWIDADDEYTEFIKFNKFSDKVLSQ